MLRRFTALAIAIVLSWGVFGDCAAAGFGLGPVIATGATTARNLSNHFADHLSVLDYGAKCDGSTDDTAAFDAAITAANSTLNPQGAEVDVPAGVCIVSTLTALSSSGGPQITLSGIGPRATILRTNSASGNVITIAAGAPQVTTEHIGFDSSVTRTGGAYISSMGGANLNVVRDFFMEHYYYGIQSADNIVEILDGEFSTPVPTRGVGIQTNATLGGVIDNVLMRPPGPGLQPKAGIEQLTGGGLAISNSQIIQQGSDFLVDPVTGSACCDVISNTYFDTANYGINISPSGNANVSTMFFSNDWVATHSVANITIVNGGIGNINQISFNNVMSIDGSAYGLYVTGPVNYLTWTGGLIYGNTTDGLSINKDTTFVTIADAQIYANGAGILVRGSSNDYITIHDNILCQNTNTAMSFTSALTHNNIHDNKCYNPLGVFGVTPGASPWTYTNGPTPATLYLTGGTVSSVTQDGQTLPTSGSYQLGPNDAVVVTYSRAPTVTAVDH